MSAIDNKHLIDILAVNVESGTSRKTGLPWSMPKAQCSVYGPDGVVKVGELILPKALAETTPGRYLAEFELDVSFERLVVPRITKLHPHSAAPKPQPASAPPLGTSKQPPASA